MDCIVHGVSKSWTRLSDFHSLTHSLVAYSGFPDSSVGKEFTCDAEDLVQFLGQEYPQEKG